MSVLNAKVIVALERSLEPALEKCTITWGEETIKLQTVFRNQIVRETRLMNQTEFDAITISFNCELDPTTGMPVNHEFTAADFIKVDDESSLNMFKIAAMNLPEDELTVENSIKYQVLTDETALFGEVKQEN